MFCGCSVTNTSRVMSQACNFDISGDLYCRFSLKSTEIKAVTTSVLSLPAHS